MLSSCSPQIVFPFLGTGIGGSHISTIILAEALRDQGRFSCLFICPENTPFYSEVTRRNFRVVSSGEKPADKWSPGRDLWRCMSRRKLLASAIAGRNTIVHCNDISSLQSWMIPARSLSLPIIYHHRSLNTMTLRKRLLLSRATHTICVSDATYANLGFLKPSKRSQVCNPFSTDAPRDLALVARAKLRKDLGLNQSTRVVGFVANFWFRKRPLFFADIARHMLSQDPNLHFAIFGTGREISECSFKSYVADQGLAQFTSFLGFRMPPEVNVASLDLLIAPAVDEPFGRTLVEAALVGVPFVATDDAGHSEIAHRWGGGVLVGKDESSEKFAQAALRTLSGACRITLDEAGRRRIIRDLSVEQHAESVGAVYARFFEPKADMSNQAMRRTERQAV